MTPDLVIAASERNTCRVFAVDMDLHDLRALRSDGSIEGPLSADTVAPLLGLEPEDLDIAHAEMFDVAELDELGLTDYLIEGYGIAEAAIAADRARLAGVTGQVLILFSPAFRGRAVHLRPDPRLSLVGTYAEEVPPVVFEPLPDADTQGSLSPEPGKAPMSDARISGMVATVVLVLLAVFVAVFVWMAS